MQFENVYWDWSSMQRDDAYPGVLAIGDSWFWYPFPGGSLLNALGPLLARRELKVLAIGNNGAEAFDYVQGKYSKAVRQALALQGASLSAVFLSGGGNDFAGFNDLRPLLRDDCSGATTATDCFRADEEDRSLGWLLRKTADNLRQLIGMILVSTPERANIVMHNYDYALPSGRGVFGRGKAWLKPALDDARVAPGLQQDAIRLLIDRMTLEFEALEAIDPSRIFLVDSRNTLAASDWANELHPKPAGFRKIARQRWEPVLEALELA